MIDKTLVPLIIAIVVIAAVIIAIAAFGGNIIGFFKGLAGIGEQTTNPGGTAGGTGQLGIPEKTYKIDQVGFKIGNVITTDKNVLRTGPVEFVVNSESNCDSIEYQVWKSNIMTFNVPGVPLGMMTGDYRLVLSTENTAKVVTGSGDPLGNIKMSRENVNTLLNLIFDSGGYHVDVYCLDSKNQRKSHITSKNLQINGGKLF